MPRTHHKTGSLDVEQREEQQRDATRNHARSAPHITRRIPVEMYMLQQCILHDGSICLAESYYGRVGN